MSCRYCSRLLRWQWSSRPGRWGSARAASPCIRRRARRRGYRTSYELAYLAGGPERNAVTVIEALARGHIISVDGKGQVALRESHGQAAAEASTGGLVPAQLAPVAAGRLPAAGVAAHRDAGGGGVRGGGVDLVPDRGQAARQRG